MLTLDLHPYQDEPVDRAVADARLLVAFEMGLGKTPIAIAVAEELFGTKDAECALIVVPSNLKWQWAQQIAKFTDVECMVKTMRVDGVKQPITIPTEKYCVVLDGAKAKREKAYAQILQARPDYVVLGYENVVNDWRFVRKIKPELIVLDEATAIKTFKAQRTRKIKRLEAPYRIALTGTPIENGKPEEIFSIMQWVDPEVLGRFDLFDRTYIVRNHYGGVVRYRNLPVLNQKLSQAMLRKTRKDPAVAPFLPKTQETDLYVDIDAKTRGAYKAIATDLLKELQKAQYGGEGFDVAAYYGGTFEATENTQQGRIMARMQALDMLLDHPDLIVASGMDYEESLRLKAEGVERENWAGSKYCYEVWQSGLLDDVTDSAKVDLLIDDLTTALASNPENKAIVFSFFRNALDILEDALADVGTVQYNGNMSAAAKAGAVSKFQNDPDCRVILCSHAGAFGTDLHMANYLYNFDLAWSAGKQDQINARHSRAASTFEQIYIRNLITRNTTEPRKAAMLRHKRRVGSAILDNEGADEHGRVESTVDTLTDSLKATL